MGFIDDYFDYGVDYPTGIALDPLPYGAFWQYISDTFLNAFINYVDIKKAFVVCRYMNLDDQMDNRGTTIMDPPGSFNWVPLVGTKREAYKLLCEEGRVFHSKLNNDFQDDMIILSKIGDGKWMIFEYDCDCSDCGVGRFETIDTDEQVIASFAEYVNTPTMAGDEGALEIPLHYFRGWLGSR